MKNIFGKGLCALLAMTVLASCGASVESNESNGDGSSQASPPPFILREKAPPPREAPADMGSYVAENTAPPAHLDLDRIRTVSEEVANAVAEVYQGMDYHDGFELTWLPTEEERREIAGRIGALGYPVAGEHMDFINPDPVYAFCRQVEEGGTASLGIFTLEGYGRFTHCFFSTENGNVYTAGIPMEFDLDGTFRFPGQVYETLLDHFFLTDKGFLLYGNTGTGWAGLGSGFRVRPLEPELRRLEQAYLQPLGGFNGHNILTREWDAGSLEDLSFNDAFEMLYEYENGISPDDVYERQYTPSTAYVKAIPAADFEGVMTRYFNVDRADLRAWAVYDDQQDAYAWQMYISNQYQPAWEVVGCRENGDGSLTLEVDTFSIRHYQDHIATNYLTVMPREDGTFFYVSNRIQGGEEVGERKWFPAYTPRIKRQAPPDEPPKAPRD